MSFFPTTFKFLKYKLKLLLNPKLDIKSLEEFSKILKNHLEVGGAAVIATHIDIGLTSLSLNLEDYKSKPGDINASAEAFL